WVQLPPNTLPASRVKSWAGPASSRIQRPEGRRAGPKSVLAPSLPNESWTADRQSLLERGVLLGEQRASKTRAQGSNPCTPAGGTVLDCPWSVTDSHTTLRIVRTARSNPFFSNDLRQTAP